MHRSVRFAPVLAGLAALVGWLAPLRAQCPLEWTSGGQQPQLSGTGRCSTLWDPDGAGPLPQRLVIGGQYLIGGAEPSNQLVMTWDGSQWESLGPGPGTTGGVAALTTWNGMLVAGGGFTGGGTDYIALWSGSQWLPLGAGFPVGVHVLTVWNGVLVAASHTTISGVTTPIIRTWNGVTWTALPTPPSLQFPNAAVSYQGLLCVGGASALERWNGTAWLPSIPASPAINCLVVRPTSILGGSDSLYAAGSFTIIGGTPMTRLAGTSGGAAFAWNAIGGGLANACTALHVRSTGPVGFVLTAATSNTTTPVMAYTVTGLGSGSWAAMGTTSLQSLSHYAGNYHGTTAATGDDMCRRYDGSAWVPVRGPGIDGEVRAATRMGDDVIVGGTFTNVSGSPMSRIARWDGTTFQQLGTGLIGSSVDALLTLDDGDVVAGGLFLQGGPVGLNHLGRWNGSAWSPFGTGFNHQVLAICKMPNGDLVAGGKFTTAGGTACARIARWDGSAWSSLGLGMNGDVRALAVRSDGTLFAGGAFTTAGGVACNRIAQWNGTTWFQVGAGCNNDVHALAVRPNDDVVAVGSFTSAGGLPSRCSRWTGSAWMSMVASSGDPAVTNAVLALPNGDVIAGRGFHQPSAIPDAGLSRWNGSTWSGIGSGLLATHPTQSVAVRALTLRQNGEPIVAGLFSAANGVASRNLARLEPACPALATSYGTGCSSTAGPLVLTADTLPWIGATFRTTTTGVATGSLCLGLTGLSQLSIPLPALLAEGQPGCTLLSSLDIVTVLANGAGNTARSQFALSNDPSLLGVPFFQQTIPFEFDLGGAVAAVRASNALALVIGTL